MVTKPRRRQSPVFASQKSLNLEPKEISTISGSHEKQMSRSLESRTVARTCIRAVETVFDTKYQNLIAYKNI